MPTFAEQYQYQPAAPRADSELQIGGSVVEMLFAHRDGTPLPKYLALGLTAFLNNLNPKRIEFPFRDVVVAEMSPQISSRSPEETS